MHAFETSNRPNLIRTVRWFPLGYAAIKLNVDGSCFGNPGRLGFGGLARNAIGEWRFGFSGFCGHITNLRAELLAMACGLKITWEAGYKEVMCESDSKIALELIQKVVDTFHPHAPLVSHIRKFTFLNWKLSFHHTFREDNECANWLAKYGASSDAALVHWPSCPMEVALVLFSDALGVYRLRP